MPFVLALLAILAGCFCLSRAVRHHTWIKTATMPWDIKYHDGRRRLFGALTFIAWAGAWLVYGVLT